MLSKVQKADYDISVFIIVRMLVHFFNPLVSGHTWITGNLHFIFTNFLDNQFLVGLLIVQLNICGFLGIVEKADEEADGLFGRQKVL